MYALSKIEHPQIKIPATDSVLSSLSDEQHGALLDYLKCRMQYGNGNRGTRLARYAKIDKLISTWQKLDQKDSEREAIEDVTGRQQALPINLPLLATHLEDTTAFFAEIYAPTGREFYSVPPKEQSDAAKSLADKMNRDTKARKYYKELCATLRALLKYNVGGFRIRWEEGGGLGQMAEPGNRCESIDVYNYLWDPSVTDVSKIPTEAEWAASISLKNRMWVTRKGLKGELDRVDKLLQSEMAENYETLGSGANRLSKKASFYRYPPNHVGLSVDGQDSRTATGDGQGVDWASYGSRLEGDEAPEIEGFEVAEMFCWLNGKDFGLVAKDQAASTEATDEKGNGYALWRFIVIDGAQVCRADRIETGLDQPVEIPHYLAFMTQDDMKEAQRSMMEMMKGFQRLASFLANIFIAGARKNIWGLKGVDPSMFDTSGLERGEVAGVLKSKISGRDVRTGLTSVDGDSGVQEAFGMLGQVMDLVRNFYPSQALPSQIAGIDRAVKSQVSAVMQGSTRRLHMACKMLDTDLMMPVRLQCYRNLSEFDSEGLSGLTEEIAAKVLGSGLEQLHAERVAEMLKEILVVLIQNPDSVAKFDLPGLFSYWSRLQNTTVDLADFVVQTATPAPQAPADGAQPTPGMTPQGT